MSPISRVHSTLCRRQQQLESEACDWPANRAADGRAPALQVGYGPDPGRDKALVNVIVEFSGATESMTLTVIVPNDGDEATLQEQGIARAKDFAMQFAANRA
jgi:hypothetical protein